MFSSILLGIVYHPPNANDKEAFTHMCTSIDKIFQVHPNTGIMIVGDFNNFNDTYFKQTYRLKQIVSKATHVKGQVLDKIFTNMNMIYQSPHILSPLGLSNHSVVLLKPSLEVAKAKGKTVQTRVRTNDPNAKSLFVHSLKNINWYDLYQLNTCKEQFHLFQNTFHTLLDTFMPKVEITRCTTD